MAPKEKQLELPFAWDRAFEPGPVQNLPGLESDDFDLTSLPPDCVAIKLNNGGYTLVDEEDECRVDEYTWYKFYSNTCRTWYARAYGGLQDKRIVLLIHRVLFGLTPEDRTQVDHKNHNGLDNRRSENIRLASGSQNGTNRRKIKEASSKYPGVSKDDGVRPWRSSISIANQGARKSILLGFYESEKEAAFAYRVAATLLRDPNFLPDDITAHDVDIDVSRKDKIRFTVILRVKSVLAGKKGNPKATSQYYGVSYLADEQRWRAQLAKKPKTIYLGFFPIGD